MNAFESLDMCFSILLLIRFRKIVRSHGETESFRGSTLGNSDISEGDQGIRKNEWEGSTRAR